MITLLPLLVSLSVWQQPEPEQLWTRRSETGSIVSLDIVSRKYSAEGKPDVWLIGVVHIGEQSFYDDVASLLEEMDIVLYESVRPTGSRPPSGLTTQERVNSTEKALAFVADTAKRCAEETSTMPLQLEDVVREAALLDRRLAGFVADASTDAWGRPFVIQIDESTKTITLMSLGSDGKVGGKGAASDLTERRVVRFRKDSSKTDKANEKNVQQELADALGLEFQLDSLSYESQNWFCSDLTMGEVEAKLIEQGADASLLEAITGESFSAQIATGMMKLIPMLDSLTGGGIKETAKLLMIEILSMAGSDQMLEGIQPELAQVIIVDRNTELLRDLAATIGIAEDLSTIGVLYGAGHMPDLSKRLHAEFGYAPVEDRWFESMAVDPRASLLSEKDLKRLKVMLQYQLYKARQKLEKENESAE